MTSVGHGMFNDMDTFDRVLTVQVLESLPGYALIRLAFHTHQTDSISRRPM